MMLWRWNRKDFGSVTVTAAVEDRTMWLANPAKLELSVLLFGNSVLD